MCEGSNFSTSLPTLVISKCVYFYYGHPSGRLLYGGDFESVEMKTRFLSGSSRELLDKLNDAHSLGTMFWKNSSFVLLHPAPGMQTVIFQGYWWAGKWGIGSEQIKKLKFYIYILQNFLVSITPFDWVGDALGSQNWTWSCRGLRGPYTLLVREGCRKIYIFV